jgi:uncharacterized protein
MLGLGRTARLTFLAFLSAGPVLGAGDSPPAPDHYFNDYAGFVSRADATRLDEKLRQFDEASSTQIVVAIFPELPSPSLEDFTVRAAQSWRVGRKKLDNGAVLFVFVKDRKMRIEVGYGLEGALTDLRSKQILDDDVSPRLRDGNPAGALEAGIDAMVAVTRGEYQAAPAHGAHGRDSLPISLGTLLLIALVFVAIVWLQGGLGPMIYTGRGWRGGGWGGGGWGGGGWGGGISGGGGFSGGGGSFGGGGASGSW